MTRAYLTVTLKRAIVEMARAQVGHGGVKSLSDFVEGAVIERLQKEGAAP
jgi:Arc/MetJ-type ribon-helix-helix transcriptional regulator